MVVGTRRVSASQRAATQSTAQAAALLAQQAANIANPVGNPATAALPPAPQLAAGNPPPLTLPNPRKDELRILFLSFGMNSDTAEEIQKQMFETTDDFILFEYESFYGFWKAMEKSPAVYANRQIWVSPREREQLISLHS